MTQEEHNAIIEQIRTAQTDVERNNLLLNLTQDYQSVLNTNKELTEKNATLEKDNTEYAKLNNRLFLQIGSQSQQETQHEEQQQHEPPQKLSFDNLKFDD